MKHTGGFGIEGSDGRRVPDPTALERHGPLVSVIVTPSAAVMKVLAESGKTAAQARVHLLIDTGAELTSIHDDVIQTLGVQPVRMQSIGGVSGKPEDYPVYRLMLHIGVTDGTRSTSLAVAADVVGMPPSSTHPDMRGLIGRDFLRHFRLVYDGPSGGFELVEEKITAAPMSRAARRRADRDSRDH